MSELRPPTRADLEAFAGFNDTFDYAELQLLDPAWGYLYDTSSETFEERDLAAADARMLEFLAKPEAKDHILGFVYSWQHTPDEWVYSTKLLNTFAGDHYRVLPRSNEVVFEHLQDLLRREILIRRHAVYRLGPAAPLEKFPELGEDFEAWVYDTLSAVPLLPGTLALEYFGDDVTPFEYWAGMRKIFQMRRAGTLQLDAARCICLPPTEDAELDSTLTSIDAQLSESAEKALRQFGMNRVRIVKPQQRGRDGGVGRKRG